MLNRLLHRRSMGRAALGFLAAGLAVHRPALAQPSTEGWPNRSVRLVVPYSPAGSSDAVGRFFAERLSTALGQPVVVENRNGLAGTLGMDVVAKSPPDGYTVVLATANQTINETLQPRRPHQLMRDFAPVAMLNRFPLAMAISKELPANNAAELIAYAKANPGRLDYASSGPGSVYHLSAEIFAKKAGITMQHVPFRNYNEARTALMAGQIHLMFDVTISLAQLINAGLMRGIATTGTERSTLLPNLPLLSDTVAGYEASQWNALLVPAGTPASIIARINTEVHRILVDPGAAAFQQSQGAVVTPMSPAELTSFIRADIDEHREAIALAGVRPE